MNQQERKGCCPRSKRYSFEGNDWEEGKVCPSRASETAMPAMVWRIRMLQEQSSARSLPSLCWVNELEETACLWTSAVFVTRKLSELSLCVV